MERWYTKLLVDTFLTFVRCFALADFVRHALTRSAINNETRNDPQLLLNKITDILCEVDHIFFLKLKICQVKCVMIFQLLLSIKNIFEFMKRRHYISYHFLLKLYILLEKCEKEIANKS